MRVQLKSIICATDFSDFSNRTIPYGVALAKEFDARLYICHVIDLSSIAIYGEFQLDPVGQQERIKSYAYDQLEQLIGEQPVAWEPLITVGRTGEEIARLVEEKEVDLVISATRGRSGLKRIILGSVTERLMRTLTCPLLVVHSPEHRFVDPVNQQIRLERILVGCDFSPDSSLAFQYGLSMAQEFQSELHLAHVMEHPAYQHLLKPPSATEEEIRQELRNHLTAKLNAMVPREARNWCSPQTSLLEGRPYEELSRYAEDHAIDMIILGVRGHGLVKTLLVGSTTDRVVREAPCPVLSVGTGVRNE
ncbi:MAG: universal stress protein [Desulfobacterales bacterium]|nr:MAG: universal stress protein [Desulfobacterales bacterium]